MQLPLGLLVLSLALVCLLLVLCVSKQAACKRSDNPADGRPSTRLAVVITDGGTGDRPGDAAYRGTTLGIALRSNLA